ncbi:MAG: ACT domain-containing protein [Candidatus Micrarchaeia archaeon]|jgi:hypothetical protein
MIYKSFTGILSREIDMKQITVVVADKVGVLAELSYLLGKAHVNIEAISAEVQGGKSVINLVVSDDKKAEMILKSNGYHVLAGEMLVVKVKDAPGALSEISKKLQKAKINIESIYLLTRGEGHSLDALMVDKPKKAKKVLAEYLVKAE